MVTGATSAVSSVVFVVSEADTPPYRYRVQTPAEGLVEAGLAVDILQTSSTNLAEQIARYDAVVFFRVAATESLIRALEQARQTNPGIRVFFDIDDPLFDSTSEALLAGAFPVGTTWEAYRTMLLSCGALITSTAELARRAAELGLPSVVVPNGVNSVLAQRSRLARKIPRIPGPARVAFMDGSGAHAGTMQKMGPIFEALLEQHPHLTLWIFGISAPPSLSRKALARVRSVPFMDWSDLAFWVRQMDVVLAPNGASGAFADTKSALKWLESALVGVPVVATATEPFRAAVTDRVTGLLVPGADLPTAAWLEAIDFLLDDRRRRRKIGRAALHASERYSTYETGLAYRVALESIHAEPSPTAIRSGEVAALSPQDVAAPTITPARVKAPLGKKVIARTILGR